MQIVTQLPEGCFATDYGGGSAQETIKKQYK